jgi:hypothetical protein
MARESEIVIHVILKAGISMWDAIKFRVSGADMRAITRQLIKGMDDVRNSVAPTEKPDVK